MSGQQYKVGDRVRLVIDDHFYHPKGYVFVVNEVDSDGDVWDANNICVKPSSIRIVTTNIDALKDAVVEAARFLNDRRHTHGIGNLYTVQGVAESLDALDKATRKTPEQLRRELDDAADSIRSMLEEIPKISEMEPLVKHYDAAKAAHEEALKDG